MRTRSFQFVSNAFYLNGNWLFVCIPQHLNTEGPHMQGQWPVMQNIYLGSSWYLKKILITFQSPECRTRNVFKHLVKCPWFYRNGKSKMRSFLKIILKGSKHRCVYHNLNIITRYTCHMMSDFLINNNQIYKIIFVSSFYFCYERMQIT